MKILLVHPPVGANVIGAGILFLGEPLALETIAAPLTNHEVRILDMRIDNTWLDLRNELADFSPDIVGVTALTTETNQALNVLRCVKAFNPDILTVVGGQHATHRPMDFNEPFVDILVIGEGTRTFKKIIEGCALNRDLSHVKGIALRNGNSLSFTGLQPRQENLDNTPIPARHLTRRYRNMYFRGTWRPYACLVTSRGCPYSCKFCSVWKTENGKYRVRSPRKVVEELKSIEEDKVGISDDNFLHNVKRAECIYEMIKTEGIRKKYKIIGRSDTIVRRPDIVEKWREIGTEIVVVGIESFRDKDLKDYNKKTSVEKNNRAIRILQENGITVSAHFVIHQDYEEKDFQELAYYVEEMELKQPIFCVLTPLPGTDLYEETKDKILTDDYEKYDFIHSVLPTKLPMVEFYRQLVELYRKCYLQNGKADEKTYMSESILRQGFSKIMEVEETESAILSS